MKKFEELSKEKASTVESSISEYWQDINVLDASIDKRDKHFVFMMDQQPLMVCQVYITC